MPGRKADPGQYDEANRYGPLRGGRCSVGEGIPAPHRLTIRLSEAQWQQLNLAAQDMRKPLAKAVRRLLMEGVGRYWLNPEAPLEGLPAKRRKGRPVVSGSNGRRAGQ